VRHHFAPVPASRYVGHPAGLPSACRSRANSATGPGLHENVELVVWRKALPLDATGDPQRPFSKKWTRAESKGREQGPPGAQHISGKGGVTPLDARQVDFMQRLAV
jgi:hypothetical protein